MELYQKANQREDKGWSIGQNTVGYLPEDNPAWSSTKLNARAILQSDLLFDWGWHYEVETCSGDTDCETCVQYDAANNDILAGASDVMVGNTAYWIVRVRG